MDATAVAEFLQNNPRFLDQHAEIFSNLRIPHPHNEGTISLAERQLLTVRDKNRQLEAKLAELIQYGQENDAISEKLHLLSLDLMRSNDLGAALDALSRGFILYFGLPANAVRIWSYPSTANSALADRPEFSTPSPELCRYLATLQEPHQGPEAPFELASWFEVENAQGTPLKSFALLPLKAPEVFGVLALASPDEQHFHAGQGDFYLIRLAQLVTAVCMRFSHVV